MAKITYGDKTFINENVGVADINKVKDTDMNEIKSVVNDNYDELDTMKANEEYSTNETTTNSTWINGKPIYRKVVSQVPFSSTINQVAIGVNTIEEVVNMYGFLNNRPINYRYTDSTAYYIMCYVDTINSNKVLVTSCYSGYAGYANIVIEYTKTTD